MFGISVVAAVSIACYCLVIVTVLIVRLTKVWIPGVRKCVSVKMVRIGIGGGV